MPYQHFTDEALVKQLPDSNEKAFKEIYLRHWQRVFRFALVKISNREAVEDICHDLFLSLWQRRSQVKIANLEAYLIQAGEKMQKTDLDNNLRPKNANDRGAYEPVVSCFRE